MNLYVLEDVHESVYYIYAHNRNNVKEIYLSVTGKAEDGLVAIKSIEEVDDTGVIVDNVFYNDDYIENNLGEFLQKRKLKKKLGKIYR